MTKTKRKALKDLFEITKIEPRATVTRKDKRTAMTAHIAIDLDLYVTFGNAESHDEKHTLNGYARTDTPDLLALMVAADASLNRSALSLAKLDKSDRDRGYDRSSNTSIYTWAYTASYAKTADMPKVPDFSRDAYGDDYDAMNAAELAWSLNFLGIGDADLAPLKEAARSDVANRLEARVNDARCQEANRLARLMSDDARERAEKITRYEQKLAALRAELVAERVVQSGNVLDDDEWHEDATYNEGHPVGRDIMRAARARFRDYFTDPAYEGGFGRGGDEEITVGDFAKVRAEVKVEDAKGAPDDE